MLPFVMMPRPLQESNVVGKGGTAGFLGRAYDPYTLYPPGDDMDMDKMDRIKTDDLQLRPDVNEIRLDRRASLRETITEGMPDLEKATSQVRPGRATTARPSAWCSSGKARDAFDLTQGDGRDARALRQEHVRPVLPAGPPADRGGHARGRGELAEGRQLGQPLVGRPRRPVEPHEEPVGPDARRRPVAR